VEWLVYHDLWSKMAVFGDMLAKETERLNDTQRRGPRNMLDDLPDTFNKAQLEALRESENKPIEGASNQLRKWLHRKFIDYCTQTGIYTKTEEYLKKIKK
jgi:hypothetical protein